MTELERQREAAAEVVRRLWTLGYCGIFITCDDTGHVALIAPQIETRAII